MQTLRSCGLHQKDRQRLSYAATVTEVDVSLLRLAPKDKHRVNNVINVDVLLLWFAPEVNSVGAMQQI